MLYNIMLLSMDDRYIIHPTVVFLIKKVKIYDAMRIMQTVVLPMHNLWLPMNVMRHEEEFLPTCSVEFSWISFFKNRLHMVKAIIQAVNILGHAIY